jgi:superfamily II DNA or RNA helicase
MPTAIDPIQPKATERTSADVRSVRLTPQGHLYFAADAAGKAMAERVGPAFARGAGHGLLALALDEVTAAMPFDLAFWREFAGQFVTAVCARPELGEATTAPTAAIDVPPHTTLTTLVDGAPPMQGGEYLSPAVLTDQWQAMSTALAAELAESGLGVAAFLKQRSPAWSLVGRVHFNLAENRKDADAPFAFMATYTTRLSAAEQAQHLPLGRALKEYAGAANKDRLLSLLLPVQKAAEACSWLKAMVDAGEIYHPLRWTPAEAQLLLRDVPLLERSGVVVRMPATWRTGRPARPQVKASVGGKPPSMLGLDALLDFDYRVSLDGETLTAAEVKRLLVETAGLALVRGKWVEIDRDRLSKALERFQDIERRAGEEGLSFAEAMRLVAGAEIGPTSVTGVPTADWSQTTAGPWLAETLAALRQPGSDASSHPGPALQATLRPYQQEGVAWLALLARLGLGACLADDMGLGKTIQVISLMLVLKQDASKAHSRPKRSRGLKNEQQDQKSKPSILLVPASLIGNWAAEIARFAPSLVPLVVHPSVLPADEMRVLTVRQLAGVDLVLTTYGTLQRSSVLQSMPWRLAILDEAQAIKNPGAKQTRAVKLLKADARIAMTGTPVENSLGDLWSLFDFINPGLLGTAKEFTTFTKHLADRGQNAESAVGAAKPDYGPLRTLVRPYVLRRMKSDKSIIADLPDKTEVKTFCTLSKRQAALYQETVAELAERLKEVDGIQRKGLVLATLMRLKQICNHPSQWLGNSAWKEADSGKLMRLGEIIEEIASRQEKVLVFTQFKEITAQLASILGRSFGREGLVLTGQTAVAKRKDLVRRFQDDEQIPFFVLSLKAGGAGLNLTAASHVVHFDRWWNPAVENQATDRAFRIGQKRNVLVHKFVCRGTVEDRIDQMIDEKAKLAGDILGGGAEAMLTEMRDDELLSLVALDLASAQKED